MQGSALPLIYQLGIFSYTDSDASRYGIGPVHFKITDKESINKERWWSNWRYMVPVTMFGNNRMCDLSPQNHPTKSLENLEIGGTIIVVTHNPFALVGYILGNGILVD